MEVIIQVIRDTRPVTHLEVERDYDGVGEIGRGRGGSRRIRGGRFLELRDV